MKMIIKKKIGLPNLSVTNLNLGREGKWAKGAANVRKGLMHNAATSSKVRHNKQ
jgi:hypothetical protein